ncbi:MAG: GDP-mannose 4,6-dehydratase [Chitinophagales bacterium]|nr:GDP-mannose 4,6-dehydratase [Chitinophagales bacterium]
MLNILVTGCAGFIGSNLSEFLLEKNFNVIGIDNFDNFYDRNVKEKNLQNFLRHKNFNFFELDITEKEKLFISIPAKVDLIIHLAAKAGVLPSLKNPQEYIDTNIKGTNNLLELAVEKNIKKFIFASSSSVYGNNNKIPFNEEDATDYPISPYAFTKKSCELMNYNYHNIYDIDIINLRFFTVYGPKQRPDLAIHKFFKLIYEDKPIQMYGNGDTARDYTYIDDTVNGILGAIGYIANNNKIYETINLGNNSPIKLNELIAAIYKTTGKPINVQKKPMQPGDVNVTYASIDKAKKILNYNPSTNLKDGLKKFQKWYLQNYEA